MKIYLERVACFVCFFSWLLMPMRLHAENAPPKPTRPNILFAIADDQSWPHTSAYGCPFVKTPGFDEVAKGGLLFTQAYTPNAKCAPSRACILTGRNSWQLGAAANHHTFWPEHIRTFPEALGDHGYYTGSTGKGWGPGSAKGRELCGPVLKQKTAKPPTSGISNTDYAGNFEVFLERRPKEKPFCFWYGAYEPHRGYQYQSGATLGGKSIDQVDRVPPYWPDTEVVRNDLLDYAFEIEHFDHHLVRMLRLLESRGELENTLVIVTADNGMPFPRAKGQAYEISNHLPLAIMWPKGIRKAGRVIDDYISFIDFAPTILDVAGITAETGGLLPPEGRSLRDIFESGREGDAVPGRDYVLIGKEMHDTGRPENAIYPIRGIVRDGYLFAHNLLPELWPAGNPMTGYPNTDGSPTKSLILDMRRQGDDASYWSLCFGKRSEKELYNLKADPNCVNNLAEDPSQATRVVELETFLQEELKRQKDPRVVGPPHFFESFPSTNGTWGMYERLLKGEKVNAGWIKQSDREASDAIEVPTRPAQ